MGTATIDRLIHLVAIHKQVQKSFDQLEEELNDREIAARLRSLGKRIKSDKLLLGPWPFDLEDKITEVYKLLKHHFSMEEDLLSECCDTLEHPDLVSALSAQHWEHYDLLIRVEYLVARIRDLVNTPASGRQYYLMANSSELREYISSLSVLLESHADEEMRLFESLSLKLSRE